MTCNVPFVVLVLACGTLACEGAGSGRCSVANETTGLLQLHAAGRLPNATSFLQRAGHSMATGAAGTYTVFEDFEDNLWLIRLEFLGTESDEKGRVTDSSTSGSGGAEGSAKFLTGMVFPYKSSLWFSYFKPSMSPVTSQVGTTLQTWVRFPGPSTADNYKIGHTMIGFDSSAAGSKLLFLDSSGADLLHLGLGILQNRICKIAIVM